MTVLRVQGVISNSVTVRDMIEPFQLVIQIHTIMDFLRGIRMGGIKQAEVLEEKVSNQYTMERAT
jgi:hypothetical protein